VGAGGGAGELAAADVDVVVSGVSGLAAFDQAELAGIDAALGTGVTTPRDLAEYDALPLAARLPLPTEPTDGQDKAPR